MEENWYAVQQHAHDRIADARRVARSQALLRELTPRHRGRYTAGIALIRLGAWILARGIGLPAEVARTLAALQAATDRA